MHKHILILAALATVTLAPTAHAQLAIDWYTTDGGGGTSAGGGFTLVGTIGQPDASSFATPMAGGSFTLVGGFWSVATGAACPCEFDGDPVQVDVFDLLAYLDLWFPADPGADVDGAPGVDVFDLLAFLDCWFPASSGAPCP